MFRKRELFKIWEQCWNDKDRKKYCEEKIDAKRVVYIAMKQKPREAVEKVDSCRDGRELFRIARQRAGEMLMVLVVLKMKVGQRK